MRALLRVALFVCLAAVATAGQSPSDPRAVQETRPTFRGGINYVRVDLYATAKDGTPITDLGRDEIELFEDGHRQRIEDFEFVQVRTRRPQDERIEPPSVTQSRIMAADPRARVFVIFLDTYHTQLEGSARMLLPLIRFLDRLLGADDLVALMTPEMSASDITLGRKTTVISNIMQAEWTWGRHGRLVDNDPIEELYESCWPRMEERETVRELTARRRERLTLDALEDLIVHLQGMRDERKAILAVSEGWQIHAPNPKLAGDANSGDRLARPPLSPFGRTPRGDSDAGSVSGTTRVQCETDRRELALLDHRMRLRRITSAANRGNVTFYPVYALGLAASEATISDPQPPGAMDHPDLRARQNALRELAEETDGTAVTTSNDTDAVLSRIADDLSSYYLLGYSSTNTRLDGKFRSISVRVKRPDVRIRSRRGYLALTSEEVAGRRGVTSAAAVNSTPMVAIDPRAPFRVRASVWTTAVPKVWVVGELDFATRRDLAWGTGGTAEITLGSEGGERFVVTAVPLAAEGTFTAELKAARPLMPGEYTLRVRVTPHANQGLPVSDLIRLVVPGAAADMGEPLLLRRGPSTGTRYQPTADPRFRRNERLRLEFPTDGDAEGFARLVDRSGSELPVPVVISMRADAAGFRWLVADTTLAPLAAGDYSVEVRQGTALRSIPFRVVP